MSGGCLRLGRGGVGVQARSLKKVLRRGRTRGCRFLEKLMKHMSLGNINPFSSCRTPAAPIFSCCSRTPHIACSSVRNDRKINRATKHGQVAGRSDEVDDGLQMKAASSSLISGLASCCFSGNYLSYRPLLHADSAAYTGDRSEAEDNNPGGSIGMSVSDHDCNAPVVLKVSILGDSNTGKTSFLAKYVCPDGDPRQKSVETMGVLTEEKIVHIKHGANIAFDIWDLGGHWQCGSMMPLVCRDAAAILIMFDLTRRSTLNSVADWLAQAKACNKSAIPVLIGTKYDHFVELPKNIQLVVIQQAQRYAKAIGAPLFFSSVVHNINVHKVFKVIVAKLLDIPCPSIPLNLNFGEPLIDY